MMCKDCDDGDHDRCAKLHDMDYPCECGCWQD